MKETGVVCCVFGGLLWIIATASGFLLGFLFLFLGLILIIVGIVLISSASSHQAMLDGLKKAKQAYEEREARWERERKAREERLTALQETSVVKLVETHGMDAEDAHSVIESRKHLISEETYSIVPEYVAYDLETTGLSAFSDRIIEIGAVKVVNGVIVDTFQELIDPERPIPKKASAVNHITDDMVKGCRKIEEVLPDFKKFIGKLPLVAHKSDFDYGFMKVTHDRVYGKDFSRRHYCTMKLLQQEMMTVIREKREEYKEIYGKDWREEWYEHGEDRNIRYRLSDLAEHCVFDIQILEEFENDAHRALTDAKIVYLAFEYLKKDYIKPKK